MNDQNQQIATIGAEMLAASAAQTGHYAPVNRWATNALHVHLSRNGRDWLMELSDETPIDPQVAHQWARACGAPDGTPVCGAFGNLNFVAQWEDAAYDPAPAPSAAYWPTGAGQSQR